MTPERWQRVASSQRSGVAQPLAARLQLASLVEQSFESLQPFLVFQHPRELANRAADSVGVDAGAIQGEDAFGIVDIPRSVRDEFVDDEVLGSRNSNAHTGVIAHRRLSKGLLFEWQPRQTDVYRDAGRLVNRQEHLPSPCKRLCFGNAWHDSVLARQGREATDVDGGGSHGRVDVNRQARDTQSDDGDTADDHRRGVEIGEGIGERLERIEKLAPRLSCQRTEVRSRSQTCRTASSSRVRRGSEGGWPPAAVRAA